MVDSDGGGQGQRDAQRRGRGLVNSECRCSQLDETCLVRLQYICAQPIRRGLSSSDGSRRMGNACPTCSYLFHKYHFNVSLSILS